MQRNTAKMTISDIALCNNDVDADNRVIISFWTTVCKTVPFMLSCPIPMSCLSVTLAYCGQTVGWIRIPLGTEVGLGPGAIVLDGDPALPMERGTAAPSSTFRPTLLWHGRPSQQLLSSC